MGQGSDPMATAKRDTETRARSRSGVEGWPGEGIRVGGWSRIAGEAKLAGRHSKRGGAVRCVDGWMRRASRVRARVLWVPASDQCSLCSCAAVQRSWLSKGREEARAPALKWVGLFGLQTGWMPLPLGRCLLSAPAHQAFTQPPACLETHGPHSVRVRGHPS